MSQPERMAPPASGGRWFGGIFLDDDLELTAAEVSLIPWATHIGQQPGPPVQERSCRMGGRQCELCGGTYFSSRRVPACSGGQQCPRAFGHEWGSVAWIDGRWVPVALLEEIVLRWNSARAPPVSSGAGGAGCEAALSALQQLLDTPLPDEPRFGAGKSAPPRPPILHYAAEIAVLARQSGRAAATPPPPPEASMPMGASVLMPPLPRPPPADIGRPGSSAARGPYSGAGPRPLPATAHDSRFWAEPPPAPAQQAEVSAAQPALGITAHLAPPCFSWSLAAGAATGGPWLTSPRPEGDEGVEGEDEAWRRTRAADHPRHAGHGTHAMEPTGETCDEEPRLPALGLREADGVRGEQGGRPLEPSDSEDSVVFGGMWSAEATVAPTSSDNADTEMQIQPGGGRPGWVP